MKITVLGMWHLGCVTAACCAEHFDVTGLDFDVALVENLRRAEPPIHEPGLVDLIRAGLDSGKLRFSDDVREACAEADILWVCNDTPVDHKDQADVDSVIRDIRACLPSLPPQAIILISSQLPAGSARQLDALPETQGRHVAVSPENLRLGQALNVFRHPDRVIVGVDNESAKAVLAQLFAPFSSNIIWMRPESAEMTKHALNGFLALSIAYMNEVARLCERCGADAKEVEQGLKSEARIGPRSYLGPGTAFSGGTLARDVVFLSELADRSSVNIALIPAIKASNDAHQHWEFDRLRSVLGELAGKTIAIFGLTYKAGTDTLRRSRAIDLANLLGRSSVRLQAWDPCVRTLPDTLNFMKLCGSPEEAAGGADALVISTGWPEFREYGWKSLVELMRRPVVLDGNRFLAANLRGITPIEYYAVGGNL